MTLPLRAIEIFHVVGTTGSLTRAADELGITPSAVSQRLRQLEGMLGTSLLTRSGRRVRLTEAGEIYLQSIGAALISVREASDRMRAGAVASLLTVRSAPTFATLCLMPRLGEFIDANPRLELRLNATAEQIDFERDRTDLDLRFGAGDWPGLHVELLARERILPVCAPALLDGRASLTPSELARLPLMRSLKGSVPWSRWFERAGVPMPHGTQHLHFDRSYMAIDAAARGLGVALESELFTRADLASGRLMAPVRDGPEFFVRQHWIVCPHDRLRSTKVQGFLTWLHTVVGPPP